MDWTPEDVDARRDLPMPDVPTLPGIADVTQAPDPDAPAAADELPAAPVDKPVDEPPAEGQP